MPFNFTNTLAADSLLATFLIGPEALSESLPTEQVRANVLLCAGPIAETSSYQGAHKPFIQQNSCNSPTAFPVVVTSLTSIEIVLLAFSSPRIILNIFAAAIVLAIFFEPPVPVAFIPL